MYKDQSEKLLDHLAISKTAALIYCLHVFT